VLPHQHDERELTLAGIRGSETTGIGGRDRGQKRHMLAFALGTRKSSDQVEMVGEQSAD